ncbi:hypothetical protein TrVE_jg13228 [Triparma verrucosa]|nr:hypothetical protein TrVE_jg13228 [Triparma verrucosa]
MSNKVCLLTNALTHKLMILLSTLTLRGPLGFPIGLPFCGFPKSVCISVNSVVCHGIPSSSILQPGDLVNVDVTVINEEGWHGDTSKSWVIGTDYNLEDFEYGDIERMSEAERLSIATRECMFWGISVVKPGVNVKRIGERIQECADEWGYSLVREYSGHGIGQRFHEGPRILHYKNDEIDVVMEPGLVITIEPMMNQFKRDIVALEDQWTIVTKDGGLSCQWEHTVLVTEDGVEILTLRDGEMWPTKVLESFNN